MSIFPQQIREFFYDRFLNKELSGKSNVGQRSNINLESARKIGILFDATDLDNRKTILDYVESLKNKKKSVRILGYFNSKLKSDHFTFRHYNKQNIDWAMRPTGEDVEEFINQKFDVLIHLNPTSSKDTEYITALSQAGLKVGPITENLKCYDLMLDASDDLAIQNFIKQVESLLQKTTTS